MKKCLICECEFERNLENFYKNQRAPDNLSPYCKECEKKKSAKWQKNNPDKVKIYRKRDNKKRKDIIAVYCKRRREDGSHREWQRNNKDKVKEYNEKRQNKNHRISSDEWIECLEFFGYKCAYCGMSNDDAKLKYNNYLHKEHVDHSGSNKIDNCIPACKSCNSSKGSRDFDTWYNKNNINFTQERYKHINEWLGKFN